MTCGGALLAGNAVFSLPLKGRWPIPLKCWRPRFSSSSSLKIFIQSYDKTLLKVIVRACVDLIFEPMLDTPCIRSLEVELWLSKDKMVKNNPSTPWWCLFTKQSRKLLIPIIYYLQWYYFPVLSISFGNSNGDDPDGFLFFCFSRRRADSWDHWLGGDVCVMKYRLHFPRPFARTIYTNLRMNCCCKRFPALYHFWYSHPFPMYFFHLLSPYRFLYSPRLPPLFTLSFLSGCHTPCYQWQVKDIQSETMGYETELRCWASKTSFMRQFTKGVHLCV